jgi:hypothetical protein
MDMITLAMAKAYTDRLGFLETEKNYILKDFNNKVGVAKVTMEPIPLVVGETYFVDFDGTVYECQCRPFSSRSMPNGYQIGNKYLYYPEEGYIDSGEPFVMLGDMATGMGSYNLKDNYSLHTISIYQEKKVFHPIDQKFIPPMDSITLNGADGKQYKVTVNESGALTATAIE